MNQQLNENGEWVDAIPSPYPYRLPMWIWLRVTGWRDAYGRKAVLMTPIFDRDI